jgi:hypothetical protein
LLNKAVQFSLSVRVEHISRLYYNLEILMPGSIVQCVGIGVLVDNNSAKTVTINADK